MSVTSDMLAAIDAAVSEYDSARLRTRHIGDCIEGSREWCLALELAAAAWGRARDRAAELHYLATVNDYGPNGPDAAAVNLSFGMCPDCEKTRFWAGLPTWCPTTDRPHVGGGEPH